MNKIEQIKNNRFVSSVILKQILGRSCRVIAILPYFVAMRTTKDRQGKDKLKSEKQHRSHVRAENYVATIIGKLAPCIQNYYERFIICY